MRQTDIDPVRSLGSFCSLTYDYQKASLCEFTLSTYLLIFRVVDLIEGQILTNCTPALIQLMLALMVPDCHYLPNVISMLMHCS